MESNLSRQAAINAIRRLGWDVRDFVKELQHIPQTFLDPGHWCAMTGHTDDGPWDELQIVEFEKYVDWTDGDWDAALCAARRNGQDAIRYCEFLRDEVCKLVRNLRRVANDIGLASDRAKGIAGYLDCAVPHPGQFETDLGPV